MADPDFDLKFGGRRTAVLAKALLTNAFFCACQKANKSNPKVRRREFPKH
jgi:hypothetical protein